MHIELSLHIAIGLGWDTMGIYMNTLYAFNGVGVNLFLSHSDCILHSQSYEGRVTVGTVCEMLLYCDYTASHDAKQIIFAFSILLLGFASLRLTRRHNSPSHFL